MYDTLYLTLATVKDEELSKASESLLDALISFKLLVSKKIEDLLKNAEDMRLSVGNDNERIYTFGNAPWDDAEWVEIIEYLTEGGNGSVVATTNLGFCYPLESFTVEDLLSMLKMCNPKIKTA